MIAFLGILMIPVATSSLRGLNHVLTCKEAVDTPFSVHVPEEGQPILLSSAQAEYDPSGRAGQLCDGLTLDIVMGRRVEDRASMRLELANHSDDPWRGSVRVEVDDITIPVYVGRVAAGEVASHTVDLRLSGNTTYDIDGHLLVGP